MYIVDGFVFENETIAKQAQKEEEGIRFIKERTALNNSEVVLKLYKKLIEQEVFETAVGMRFLIELQNILYASPQVAKDEVPPIRLGKVEMPEKEVVQSQSRVEKQTRSRVRNDYKKAFGVALFFAIVFGVSVVGMFLVTKISSNNINILNYREEIIDEYSIWEAELEKKEAELKKWEKELDARDEAQ